MNTFLALLSIYIGILFFIAIIMELGGCKEKIPVFIVATIFYLIAILPPKIFALLVLSTLGILLFLCWIGVIKDGGGKK